jgi:hypothetical protein
LLSCMTILQLLCVSSKNIFEMHRFKSDEDR